MAGIDQDIVCVRNDGRWHAQKQTVRFRQPIIAQRAGVSAVTAPSGRKFGEIDPGWINLVINLDRQELEAVGQIFQIYVHQYFQQRTGGMI